MGYSSVPHLAAVVMMAVFSVHYCLFKKMGCSELLSAGCSLAVVVVVCGSAVVNNI